GAGAVFGVLALNANSQSKDLCNRATNPGAPAIDFDPSSGHCFANTQELRDSNAKKSDARTDANIANVMVPIGAIAIVAGAYLFFHATKSSAALTPSASRGGAALRGTF